MADIIDFLNKTRQGVMFVIEAPSGTGKTTIIKELLSQDKNLKFSVSVTTRKKREGEIEGVDYYYISDEEYNKLLKQDAFYEYVDSQYGNRYATLKSEVDAFINTGQDVIFDMDWIGMHQIKSKAKSKVVSIYLLPPSIKEVKKRLENRGTDSIDVIEQRMSVVGEKIKHWNEFDYVLVNADLKETIKDIQNIISAERLKRRRQKGLKTFVRQLFKEIETEQF